ncbi:hypothetical protein [Frateuria sp. Soil773]|uniref:hypothetical protein n=1 Tax=Frateuria sp. Soil773 TaxID=1736407 RepID=UPI0012F7AA2F|nr:hypothetical protein [Frateuria sp. Soil773]
MPCIYFLRQGSELYGSVEKLYGLRGLYRFESFGSGGEDAPSENMSVQVPAIWASRSLLRRPDEGPERCTLSGVLRGQGGSQWNVGVKAHIGLYSRARQIRSVVVATTNVHDSQISGDLLRGQET